MSSSGLVSIRLVNPDPGPVVREVTVLPATNRSAAFVVVIAPEELVVPLPPAPLAISNGLDGSTPLYSRIRISGKLADPLKCTVTVLDPPAMFLA